MRPLWIILLLVRPSGGPGPPLCPQEPFYFLVAIMKMLNCSETKTMAVSAPQMISWCVLLRLQAASGWSYVGFEEGPSVGTAVFRLQRQLDALGSRLWVTVHGPCPPCEAYPQRPVPLFLAKLLELLQEACAQDLPSDKP